LLGLGAAGEVGHHSIDLHGWPDGTGNPGGWEAYASGPAIAAMGIKAVTQGLTTHIRDLAGGDLNRISPELIKQAAEAGDGVAQGILDQAGVYLGCGLANLVIILCPHKVVIGGGLMGLGDWIMDPIWRTLRARCHTVPLDKLEIVPAALGGDAGCLGAAVWAMQQGRAV
ncbi:MAG: ROK family protein, partial [Anaerolineae bacterium]|nr:ROK family protein [Anaerolineae bacterium]